MSIAHSVVSPCFIIVCFRCCECFLRLVRSRCSCRPVAHCLFCLFLTSVDSFFSFSHLLTHPTTVVFFFCFVQYLFYSIFYFVRSRRCCCGFYFVWTIVVGASSPPHRFVGSGEYEYFTCVHTECCICGVLSPCVSRIVSYEYDRFLILVLLTFKSGFSKFDISEKRMKQQKQTIDCRCCCHRRRSRRCGRFAL